MEWNNLHFRVIYYMCSLCQCRYVLSLLWLSISHHRFAFGFRVNWIQPQRTVLPWTLRVTEVASSTIPTKRSASHWRKRSTWGWVSTWSTIEIRSTRAGFPSVLALPRFKAQNNKSQGAYNLIYLAVYTWVQSATKSLYKPTGCKQRKHNMAIPCSRMGPLRCVCGQTIRPIALICTSLKCLTDLSVHISNRFALIWPKSSKLTSPN